MIQISHKYKNLLATYFLTKIFKDFSYGENDVFCEISDKLLKKVKEEYNKEKKEKIMPFFSMGCLSQMMMIDNPNSFYLMNKENIRCNAMIENDIDRLNEILSEYPPAYINLCSIDESKEMFYMKSVKYVCPYVLFQLALLQDSNEKKKDYLEKAKDKNVFSAYLKLADYYRFEEEDYDKEIEILEEAGKKGFLFAYDRLGKMYEETDQNIALEYFKKNYLTGSIDYARLKGIDIEEYYKDHRNFLNEFLNKHFNVCCSIISFSL